jgi:hypothetical protein
MERELGALLCNTRGVLAPSVSFTAVPPVVLAKHVASTTKSLNGADPVIVRLNTTLAGLPEGIPKIYWIEGDIVMPETFTDKVTFA